MGDEAFIDLLKFVTAISWALAWARLMTRRTAAASEAHHQRTCIPSFTLNDGLPVQCDPVPPASPGIVPSTTGVVRPKTPRPTTASHRLQNDLSFAVLLVWSITLVWRRLSPGF